MFPDSAVLMRGCLLFKNSGDLLLQKAYGSLYLEKGVFCIYYGKFVKNKNSIDSTAHRASYWSLIIPHYYMGSAAHEVSMFDLHTE